MKIGCKIESMVRVNFKKLLAKVMNLIFKYILSSYFVQCDWRCSNNRYKLLNTQENIITIDTTRTTKVIEWI